MPKLEQWSVTATDPFQAPEQRKTIALHGRVSGHSRIPDGHRILTSDVISSEGRTVTTKSGTIYELGEPSDTYINWCREHNISIDLEQPVKVMGAIPSNGYFN